MTVLVVTPVPPATEPAPSVTVAPTAPASVLSIRLEADGSGDYGSLREAFLAADPGATITLGPGSFRLDEATTIVAEVHLVGAGRDQTEIVSDAPEAVLRIEGGSPVSAEGITFRHEGTQPADVVVVTDGDVRFQTCRFTGGVWTEETGIGSGLLLDGSTSGQVVDSEAVANGLHGIHLRGSSQAELAGNLCRDNDDTGIQHEVTEPIAIHPRRTHVSENIESPIGYHR